MRGNGEVVKSHAPFSDHLAGMHAYVSFCRMGNHAMRSTMALENHCSYVDVDYRQAGFSDQSSFRKNIHSKRGRRGTNYK